MKQVGSEFSWAGLPPAPFLPWPEGAWYALGRDALLAAWGELAAEGARLWAPTYFCPVVIAHLQERGVPVARFVDLPTSFEPEWATLEAAAGDVVLAVNFFGGRDCGPWRKWRSEHPGVLLIEDHTHDPFSPWASCSQADFAFLSARKTFPAPDGALLWSPAGRTPPTPEEGDWTGSALKLAGMIWKAEFLDGAQTGQPPQHRQFETAGEQRLEATGRGAASPWSRALLERGFPAAWREQRTRNVAEFVSVFRAQCGGIDGVGLLCSDWPEGGCPFNPLLLFDKPERRNAVRAEMIRQRIFSPIHWPIDAGENAQAAALSQRLLTIPLDHRCEGESIARVVKAIAGVLSLPRSRLAG